MPPRLSRPSTNGVSGAPKPKTAKRNVHKSQKRALNAFTAAQHEVKEKTKMRKHRLGEVEQEQGPKRRRVAEDDDEEDGDEDEEDGEREKRKGNESDYGSDSDGNHWRLGGPIGEDSDSSLDSDEAFGSSDEERFEGFTFRGSSTANAAPKKKKPIKRPSNADDMDLNEDDMNEEDEDSFGEDGVDLATMLDNPPSDEDDESGDEADTEDDDEDEASEDGADSGDEEEQGAKISRLQDLVASLEGKDQRKTNTRDAKDAHETQQPSDYGVTAAQKLKIADLLPTVTDPNLRKSLKVLAADKPSNRAGIPGKLAAPLPKRQQDKLDRTAATAKAKVELDKWQDTVIQNRRAEHLHFPLADPTASEPMGKTTMTSVVHDKPRTELESAIQNILEESGLSAGRKGEDEVAAAEELEMKEVAVEEAMARRAALRRARDLLFREEIKAKRIKKIKSKSYRRVHRKEREREAEKARALMGEDELEDDKEAQDRRRAMERMGAKHKESKWAKNMKATGRTVWDDDARDGVIDMARRNEELRRRIEGKDVREEDDSDVSDDDSQGDQSDFGEGSDTERARLSRQLDRVAKTEEEKPQKGIAGMAFMRRAEAAKKAANDEAIADLRRTLAGDSDSEHDQDADTSIGRKVFGPKSTTTTQAKPKKTKQVFEEAEDSAADSSDEEVEITVDGPAKGSKAPVAKGAKQSGKEPAAAADPWTTAKPSPKSASSAPVDDVWASRKAGSRKNQKYTAPQEAILSASIPLDKPTPAPSKPKQKPTLSDSDSDSDPDIPLLTADTSSSALRSRAFAGDDVALTFASEKSAQAASEDEQETSSHLPGWGSWAGSGLTKATRKRNAAQAHNPLFKTKVAGVRQADRKDASLANVIISEKKDRRGKKYLASELPREFERKEHYERSLRVPIGPEWNAKEAYQRATKPRVLVGRGNVEAIRRPLV